MIGVTIGKFRQLSYIAAEIGHYPSFEDEIGIVSTAMGRCMWEKANPTLSSVSRSFHYSTVGSIEESPSHLG